MTASQEYPSTFEGEVDLGVIGGTGLYALECLIPVAVLPPVETPWGKTSSPVTISRVKGDNEQHFFVAFIARHGKDHEYSPTTVPYRANIACMKRLKCKALLSFSAVGSLQHYIKPRDFTLPQQIIDRTKGIREMSFLNDTGLIGHVGFGNPFSEAFAEYLYGFRDVLENPESGDPCLMHFDRDLTVVCMEGPQFSTRAESKMYKMLGGSVINMSVLPEAKLARECELPYQIICMATDYDAWREELEPVTTQTVLGNLSNNARNANALTSRVITEMAKKMPEFMITGDGLKGTTTMSICTKSDAIPADALAKFNYLFPDYSTK